MIIYFNFVYTSPLASIASQVLKWQCLICFVGVVNQVLPRITTNIESTYSNWLGDILFRFLGLLSLSFGMDGTLSLTLQDTSAGFRNIIRGI